MPGVVVENIPQHAVTGRVYKEPDVCHGNHREECRIEEGDAHQAFADLDLVGKDGHHDGQAQGDGHGDHSHDDVVDEGLLEDLILGEQGDVVFEPDIHGTGADGGVVVLIQGIPNAVADGIEGEHGQEDKGRQQKHPRQTGGAPHPSSFARQSRAAVIHNSGHLIIPIFWNGTSPLLQAGKSGYSLRLLCG